jgi:hypothetical protein
MESFSDRAGKFFSEQLFRSVWAYVLIPIACFIGASVVAFFQGVPISIIAMIAMAGCPLCSCTILGSIWLYRELNSNRAELVIEYDPNVNLLPMGNSSSDVRLFVRNKSPRHAAAKLRVKIERLIAIGTTSADPQAGQFNNVLMKLERFKHGEDNLPPHENVEIMGPVTFASNKDFFFRSDEPAATQGRYYCKPGTYRMTVFAIADNADPARATFIVSEKNGSLYMEWDKAAA